LGVHGSHSVAAVRTIVPGFHRWTRGLIQEYAEGFI
jgi:hypothetical protein